MIVPHFLANLGTRVIPPLMIVWTERSCISLVGHGPTSHAKLNLTLTL